MFKKYTILFLISLSCLILTSCIDIFHTVSLHKGRARVTVRYTIQKAVMEMGESLSGESADYSEFDEIGDEIFGEFENVSAQIIPIDNDYHIGAEIKINGSVKDISQELEDASYLPVKKGDKYEILIPGMGDNEEVDEMALSFISGSTYSILVDLSGDLKDIKTARLQMNDNPLGNEQIMVNTYGSSMFIEIPMALLFFSSENMILELLP